MGLLGDIFSEIDRKKRQLKGLLSDPAETIYQGIRNFGAEQQGLLDTQAQAYPMIATPEQKKRIAGFARNQEQAKKELADAGAAQGMAATFAGVGAKTADRATFNQASKMLEAGADNREVWAKTGWFKGPDGRMRFEIDDSAAKLRTPEDMSALAQTYKARQLEIKDAIAQSKLYPDLFPKELTAAQKAARAESASYKAPLTEYFGLNSHGESGAKAKYAYDHKPLYGAYPDIGEEVIIRQGGNDGSYIGSYANNKLDINKAASSQPGGVNSTTAHEMQHAIQGREGFATGGNIEDEVMRLMRDELERLQVGGLSRESAIQQINGKSDYFNKTGRENYRRLAGEAEARATQARMNFTPEQRRATFPLDSYDVPIDQLIIRGLLGP